MTGERDAVASPPCPCTGSFPEPYPSMFPPLHLFPGALCGTALLRSAPADPGARAAPATQRLACSSPQKCPNPVSLLSSTDLPVAHCQQHRWQRDAGDPGLQLQQGLLQQVSQPIASPLHAPGAAPHKLLRAWTEKLVATSRDTRRIPCPANRS